MLRTDQGWLHGTVPIMNPEVAVRPSYGQTLGLSTTIEAH